MSADGVESELAGLGPFFALHRAAPGNRPAAPWRPVSALTDDPQVLGDRVAEVRAGLAGRSGRSPAEVSVRIAGSVTHLGLVARLLSPLLGLAALTDRSGGRPDPAGLGAGMGALWWQGPPTGVFPLWLVDASPETPALEALAPETPAPETSAPETRKTATSLVAELAVLTVAVARRWRVSTKVLWGNVASAANGIATQVTAARPELAGPIRSLTGSLTKALPLPGLFDGTPGTAFRRRTCCLLVHAWPTSAAAAVRCGDCVLNPTAGPGSITASG